MHSPTGFVCRQQGVFETSVRLQLAQHVKVAVNDDRMKTPADNTQQIPYGCQLVTHARTTHARTLTHISMQTQTTHEFLVASCCRPKSRSKFSVSCSSRINSTQAHRLLATARKKAVTPCSWCTIVGSPWLPGNAMTETQTESERSSANSGRSQVSPPLTEINAHTRTHARTHSHTHTHTHKHIRTHRLQHRAGTEGPPTRS